MRVTISSSSNNLIDKKYINESKKVLEYLASNNFDLNWGSGCMSIMGLCYDIFSKHNRQINGYTTTKYVDELKDLPNAKHEIYDDTLELKKQMYNDADIVLCLPGGSGTISEFLAYVEEARSNDNPKPIILYNVNNHFNKIIDLIDDLISRNFNSDSIKNFYIVINSFEEFQNYIDEYLKTE